jgi:hypothetical protein
MTTYSSSNNSWSIVWQGKFQLRDINQMECQMCQYLGWELNIQLLTLKGFQDMVCNYPAVLGPHIRPAINIKLVARSTNIKPFPTIMLNPITGLLYCSNLSLFTSPIQIPQTTRRYITSLSAKPVGFVLFPLVLNYTESTLNIIWEQGDGLIHFCNKYRENLTLKSPKYTGPCSIVR